MRRISWHPKAGARELSATDVAGRTGLEPAASGVTGRRYNQLNYRPNGERLTSMVPWRHKCIHYLTSAFALGRPTSQAVSSGKQRLSLCPLLTESSLSAIAAPGPLSKPPMKGQLRTEDTV